MKANTNHMWGHEINVRKPKKYVATTSILILQSFIDTPKGVLLNKGRTAHISVSYNQIYTLVRTFYRITGKYIKNLNELVMEQMLAV